MAEQSFNLLEYLRYRDLSAGVIHFAEDIEDVDVFKLSAQLAEARRLAQGPITIHLTSPGGSVYAALAIHDEIKTFNATGATVDILVKGYAASAASMIVLQAGRRRLALPSTRFLLHEVRKFSFMEVQRKSDMEDEMREMKACHDAVVQILADRTGKSVDAVSETFLRKEVWFSAREALEQGLIDEVVTP